MGAIEVSLSGIAEDVELARIVKRKATTCLIRTPISNEDRLLGLQCRDKVFYALLDKEKIPTREAKVYLSNEYNEPPMI